MTHGTPWGYSSGCRCDACGQARRGYDRERGWASRRAPGVDRKLLAEALREMFPFGLTDQCPARRGQR